MKTKLMIVPLIALVLSAFVFGSAAARGPQPPSDPTTGTGGRGWYGMGGGMMGSTQVGLFHDYLTAALADQLGLTVEQVEEAIASGETLYDIALANGVLEADIPALLVVVHEAAFEQAVADGILTEDQAFWMLQRMARRGYSTGEYDGIPDGTAPQDGTGYAHGRGSNTGRGTCPNLNP